MKNTKKYSIYRHIFPNKKMYFGITSDDVKKRWANGAGYDGQTLMRNAIRKYGWDNILHELILTDLTEEQAKELEKTFISLFNTTDRACGYNITHGGETSEKHGHRKMIMQCNLDGSKLHKYESIACAAESTGVDPANISACARGKLKTAGGYIWKYADKK